jgi:hypothetical protein
MSEGAERDEICLLISQSGKRYKISSCSCESWRRRLQAALTAVCRHCCCDILYSHQHLGSSSKSLTACPNGFVIKVVIVHLHMAAPRQWSLEGEGRVWTRCMMPTFK